MKQFLPGRIRPLALPYPDRPLVVLLLVWCALSSALASSHREAPFISRLPKVDATDFYMFRSYEPGREDFVTVVANYLPLQDPYGGPNYFTLSPDALYEIHIDRTGDGFSDYTFRFEFGTQYSPHTVMTDDGSSTALPFLYNRPGQISGLLDSNLGVFEPYTAEVVTAAGTFPLENTSLGSTSFFKPLDNAGPSVIPDYPSYSDQHVFSYDVSGITGLSGKLFVGQRKDPFVMNMETVFDLAGIPSSPAGDSIAGDNVLSFVIEIPIDVLTGGGATPVIGGWTTASVPGTQVLNPAPTHPGNVVLPPDPNDPRVQLSYLGMPLDNMLLIGVNSKDRYNALHPSLHATEFLQYYTNAAIVELMGFPSSGRFDMVDFYLNGLPGVNQTGASGSMLRLDTSVSPVPPSQQDSLGLLASPPDPAGHPNGRRPGDDVVDIGLRVWQGQLLGGPGPYDASDGASIDATMFLESFPYMGYPIAGQDRKCVTLTSSTSPMSSTFQTVTGAYVNPVFPDRIAAAASPDPLVYFLLEPESPGMPVTIENVLIPDGSTLEFLVGSGP